MQLLALKASIQATLGDQVASDFTSDNLIEAANWACRMVATMTHCTITQKVVVVAVGGSSGLVPPCMAVRSVEVAG